MIANWARTLRDYLLKGDDLILDRPGDRSEYAIISGSRWSLTLNEARSCVRSMIWMTYRSGFPPISSFHSDSGWGCMIRTGQMMMANTIRRIDPMVSDRSVIDLFLDSPSRPLSIHNLVGASDRGGQADGHWYAPIEICRMIETCINNTSAISITALLCDQGVFYDEIVSHCTEKPDSWDPCLILIPVRLGLDQINLIYSSSILEALSIPESAGIIGGRPRSSLFIVGCFRRKLIYLDPHYVQESVHDKPLSDHVTTYHCDQFRSIFPSELDPCLAFGFYISNRASLDDFWSKALAISHPMWDMQIARPNYTSID
uniref:Cysteine protease n=1 Tax=Spongospora subterranea TaxID=70186 RepID=A0A0H5RTV4_9EUKA|eukprot:CRZ12169.1 hypothetical protein [Spongospora subterranea]